MKKILKLIFAAMIILSGYSLIFADQPKQEDQQIIKAVEKQYEPAFKIEFKDGMVLATWQDGLSIKGEQFEDGLIQSVLNNPQEKSKLKVIGYSLYISELPILNEKEMILKNQKFRYLFSENGQMNISGLKKKRKYFIKSEVVYESYGLMIKSIVKDVGEQKGKTLNLEIPKDFRYNRKNKQMNSGEITKIDLEELWKTPELFVDKPIKVEGYLKPVSKFSRKIFPKLKFVSYPISKSSASITDGKYDLSATRLYYWKKDRKFKKENFVEIIGIYSLDESIEINEFIKDRIKGQYCFKTLAVLSMERR